MPNIFKITFIQFSSYARKRFDFLKNESSNVKRNHLLNLINDNKEVERVTLKIDELIKTLNALLIKSQDHHAIKKRMLNLEVCPTYLWPRVNCFIKPNRFYYDMYDSDYFSV